MFSILQRKNYVLIIILISLSNFGGADEKLFPTPSPIDGRIEFWKKVFTEYSDQHRIIHDRSDPSIIIDVIDFNSLAGKFRPGRSYSNKDRDRITGRYIERYKKGIARVRRFGKKASRFGAIEERILKVYTKNRRALRIIKRGFPRIRSQKGMSGEFKIGMQRSMNYLPHIENIFARRSLPIHLTRLPFVESMFNEMALSKVGASGIWQFMPLTGRQFLKVNRFFDERNSPLKATHAAADLLSSNYRAIRSWPLAVTAYNHGLSGMKRASRILKTKDIGKIVEHYRSPTFGFASKNFYAEFMAANYAFNYFKSLIPNDTRPIAVSEIKLKYPMSTTELIRATGLDKDTLRSYNRCLKASLFGSQKHRKLPKNYRLMVPTIMSAEIARKLKGLRYARTINRKVTL